MKKYEETLPSTTSNPGSRNKYILLVGNEVKKPGKIQRRMQKKDYHETFYVGIKLTTLQKQ